MLTIDQFTYHLPKELIAQHPISPRDHSRLLVLDRQSRKITHHHFYDLPNILTTNDQKLKAVLVRNNTKVIPARIFGTKTTGGHVEILLTQRKSLNQQGEIWECLTKPGLKENQKVTFENSDLMAECIQITGYTRLIQFNKSATDLFNELHIIGHTPIPPYITWGKEDEQSLRKLYQTTYAKHQGSAAAPTAGLHFTPELDQKLIEAGVQIEEVTLHVGLGTFLPVKEKDITQHHMHSEVFEIKPKVADRLNKAKQEGKKIVAVGTTTTRVLESCVNEENLLKAPSTDASQCVSTDIYIYPKYKFNFIDALITNFHLPESTLLMLVSAIVSQPNTNHDFKDFISSPIGKAYTEAIKEKYRFYSFGDAMLII